MLTLAPSTITPAPLTSMATALPSTVFALVFLPVSRWPSPYREQRDTFVSCALFSGLRRFSTVPAAFVGANTVNDLGP